jgi:urease accessory protein
MSDQHLKQLWLMQLADSALPVGATAHSFGLETLVAEGELPVDRLELFLHDYVYEAGALEGLFCRVAYRLNAEADGVIIMARWLDLNTRLSALKPARESRVASAMLGRRFLRLVLGLQAIPRLQQALQAALHAHIDIHYCTAFGLVGGALDLDEATTVLAYLQQTVAGLISACQRLMPLGQNQASQILWRIKPALLDAAYRSHDCDLEGDASFCCIPFVDLGGMRHPSLTTRLFMS